MGKDVAEKSNKRCMVTVGKNSMQYEMRVTAEKKKQYEFRVEGFRNQILIPCEF